jgi:hypothetical protein
VFLEGGEVLETSRDAGIPERDLEKQTERLREKFERLAPLEPGVRAEVCERALRLEREEDLSELIRKIVA